MWRTLWLATLPLVVVSYPVILQVGEQDQRCFRFNIPDGDDAHLITLVIPPEDELDGDDSLEKWYVDHVFAMTKQKDKHKSIPQRMEAIPPDNVASKMSNYLKEMGHNHAGLLLQITGTPTTNPKEYHHNYSTKYFTPTVVNHIGKRTDQRTHRDKMEDNLEGYGICLTNKDDRHMIHVIMDLVLVSEQIIDDDGNAARFDREQHLTPLEESLDQSIDAANTVIREMKFMEKREQRMRKTAESINNRVRWFSYLSVSVLLSVTYIQVTYLKRYFHKKKLM